MQADGAVNPGRAEHEECKEYKPTQKRLGMDCSSIPFCCGPCISKIKENPERPFLKPYDGGRYARFTWTAKDNTLVDIRNVRICRPCCLRYKEMQDGVRDFDFESIEIMHRDADVVMRKLGMSGKQESKEKRVRV